MAAARIVLLTVLLACLYGMLHDQITVRLSLEYFTVAHPSLVRTQNPTLLALGWGVLATWWAGLLVGLPLALAARAGPWPVLRAAELLPTLLALLALMAFCAVIFGFGGHYLGARGHLERFAPGYASELAPELQAGFFAALAAHTASYASGFAGAPALLAITFFRRWKLQAQRLAASAGRAPSSAS